MERLSAPCYLDLDADAWGEKKRFFSSCFSPCAMCPRRCGARRGQGQAGACLAGGDARVASSNLHFGEEPPISGTGGSGTVFFSGCTLKCAFCQNYPISQLAHGESHAVERLAAVFLALQKRGAHNINLVSPTPHLFQVVSALEIAAAGGLRIPLVYNTSGYERAEVVAALEGIVDVYLPDLKYGASPGARRLARELSRAGDYFDVAVLAIAEMFRQTGPLRLDDLGIARRGTVIRHLILPGQVENSLEVLRAIAASPFRGAWLSLMSQYFPAHRAPSLPPLDRRLQPEEWRRVRDEALRLGLEEGWFQEMD